MSNSSNWSIDRIFQVLPLRDRVDLRVMLGYSAFPKAQALLDPHNEIV